MQVQELIAKLMEQDPEAEVCVADSSGYGDHPVCEVYVSVTEHVVLGHGTEGL